MNHGTYIAMRRLAQQRTGAHAFARAHTARHTGALLEHARTHARVPCAQEMPTERYESGARSMGAARTLGSAHAGDVQPASFQLTAETVARVQRSADLRKSAALGGMPNGRVLVIVGVKLPT